MSASQQQPSAASSLAEPAAIPPKKGGQRIFLSGANSLLGLAMFDELRNDYIAIQPDSDEIENKFFVTVNKRDAATVPLPS